MTGAYLAHHGIKGMKWGIRRYQNEDGTLTAAGRERYLIGQARDKFISEKKAYRQSQSQYRKDINYGLAVYNPKMYVKGSAAQKKFKEALRSGIKGELRYRAAKNDFKYAKEDAKSERLLDKIDTSKKSKYFKKYEQEYISKGMSEPEAKLAAYKKERSVKLAQIAGATAITAAVAYAAYRHYDTSVDRFLKSGVELKRVSSGNTASVHDGFYAVLSKNKLDTMKYSGNFANELGGNAFQKSIKVGSEGIKLASEKSGASALRSIISSNDDVRKLQYSMMLAKRDFLMIGRRSNAEACDRAIKALKQGKINKDVYRGLISAAGVFADRGVGSGSDDEGNRLGEYQKKLFDQLRANGYGAIQDVNDKYFSGYHAKMPVIVIDAGKVAVNSVRYITDSERVRNTAIGTADMIAARLAPTVVGTGAAIAGVKAAKSYRRSSKEQQLVNEYRKKHPGTTKSYTEIVRMLYRYS